MKLVTVLAIACAVVFHGAVLLFGGWFFLDEGKDHGTLQQVDLLSPEETKKDEKPKEEKTEENKDEIEAETEEAPDAAEIIKSLELSPVADAPALDAASLGAIEQALNGQGGGDFGDALTFNSGGRIGGGGGGGAADQMLETVFDPTEIDQKARLVLSTDPLYPAEVRSKKLEGAVTVIFVVDATGKVINPRVEKSSHPAFEKPALEAVKQWKFEPAIKGGQRVNSKVRRAIRFQPI